ncbi:MAG: NAD(P)-binding domain-containing protein [Clostridia bacterium]|nr:NAD(P)-binding domain-containing protein [Clostridia bacterium]
MKKQFKLGVIGCSASAVSVLRGVVLSDFIREKKIIVSDDNEESLDGLNYLGVKTTLDNKFVAQNSEYLLLAVTPDKFNAVAESIEGVRPEKVISVMEGLTKSQIKNSLGVGLIKVARAVLNTPCSIGSGAIGIDMLDFNKSTDDTDFISNIFNRLGIIVSLEESKLEAVSALSGNGIYTLMLIGGLVEAGVKHGLTKNEAKILAVQSVSGMAELVQQGEKSIDELVMQECKNSSSIEAVKAFEDGGFRKLVAQAVEASVLKIKERKE